MLKTSKSGGSLDSHLEKTGGMLQQKSREWEALNKREGYDHLKKAVISL
jgi:hypothetical protein